jgi:hypothetical protein
LKENLEPGVARGKQVRVVGSQQVGTEHHLEVRAMCDGKADVGEPPENKRVVPYRGAPSCALQQAEAIDGDGGEDPRLVSEVVGWCSVRHSRSTGHLTQAQMS